MTAYCAAPKKISGSAAGLISYYKELGLELSFDATVGYYGIGRDEIVFDVIGGEVANHLPGLDTGRGITRTQFEDIMFNGAWNGQQLVSGGYRGVCKRDALGNAIKEHNPETGKLEPIYEYETVVGNRGDEVVKKKMEYAFTAGYDCPVAMDKSHSELLIAHPWYAPRYRELQIEAIKAMMQVTAERHNKVVKKTVAAPSVWAPARPRHKDQQRSLRLWKACFGSQSLGCRLDLLLNQPSADTGQIPTLQLTYWSALLPMSATASSKRSTAGFSMRLRSFALRC